MATKSKKPRAKWDSETEKRLIDVWADILEEFGGKMLKRKKKEAIATTRFNAYVSEELGRPGKYSENEVSNKLDSVIVKVNVESAASTGCPPSQDSSSPYFSRGGTRLSPTSLAALVLPRTGVGLEWSALRPGTAGEPTRTGIASATVHDNFCAKPAGDEQQTNCREDDSCDVQGQRDAETAITDRSTTTR